MKTLKFYGHSDDCFEIDGTGKGEPDEIGCFDKGVAVKVANDHAGLLVVGHYAPKATEVGTWMIGISLLDEGIKLPDWPIRFGTYSNEYSPLLEIDVPDDVRVSHAKPVEA